MTLDLSANSIERFEVSASLISLRTLKLSENCLGSFDLKDFSSVNLLYLDQNCLSNIIGLEHCQNLDVLSLREQTQSSGVASELTLDIDLGLVKDVRKVFLSSNRLSPRCLSPSLPLLRLQLLDIASCTLSSLPSDFSTNFANVKVLNMNFNSLTDLEALVGMNCLSRLMMAGNRLARMRRVCQILSRLGRTSQVKQCSLRKLDIRGNPLTVGFYPPALTGNGAKTARKETKEDKAISQDGRQDLSEALANLDQNDHTQPVIWDNGANTIDLDINDPSTLAPADPQADQKYLIHLDRTTRLRRRVLELLLYAGTGGSLQVLDGLDLRPSLGEECLDMASAWNRLEKIGVLRRKAIKDK
ncbi:hypothetical protein N7495_006455 [Penicillium taxi]|uniref:uncharacterized protein n=1 Tax=Penicillium taxi TaxID=168475 RepID=UPI002545396F|nr:uncharacterized protein N7495_006455 [Penicillium taxi]KAJ5894764.1 hypothetical protein N7495_006455 [Penicillium taxi]